MKHILDIVYNLVLEKYVNRKGYFSSTDADYGGIQYAGKKVMSAQQTNDYLYALIANGAPFLAARFGATELMCSGMYEFDLKSKQKNAVNQLCRWSGFFPNDVQLGYSFHKTLVDSIEKVDLLGVWGLRWESYYVKKYMQNSTKISSLFDLEPWRVANRPWTAALKGKKVLIIHPFEETIISQYRNREKIFPESDILPEFELKTIKAVQTVAGEVDNRFANWFEALEYMYQETLKIDYDVAIVGCGAYGLPLAAKLKASGKQAIHLGGVTQILFGIRGKRWDEDPNYAYIRKLFNDSWVHPGETERPQNSKSVEGGCYW